MTDNEIIALYWARSEAAISETDLRYGAYCHQIAYNILADRQDCEECVNDTWLRAWDSMPPERPGILSAFLGRITRNLSLDRYRRRTAQKRGSGEPALLLDELRDCLSGDDPEAHLDLTATVQVIDRFLEGLDLQSRNLFLLRYWYAVSIEAIAKRFGLTESAVKSALFRMRKKLKQELEQEGIPV